jgi:hypothetical protein
MLEVFRFNREPQAGDMRNNPARASAAIFLHQIGFILVNDRTPRGDSDCALCGCKIENGYVRKPRTRLFYCDTQCFAGHAIALKNRARKVS